VVNWRSPASQSTGSAQAQRASDHRARLILTCVRSTIDFTDARLTSMNVKTARRTASYRIGIIEAIALCLLVAAGVWYAAGERWASVARYFNALSGDAHWELEPLRQAYGPNRNSRNQEEWIIRDFFQDRRDGVFVDIGANDYRKESNTYFLETSLGWSGIAIDALPEFGPDYAKHRPKTRFVAMFASDVADSTVQFFVPDNNQLVSSSNAQFVERFGAPGKVRVVPTTTLNAVLDEAKIDKVDFVSMDIELAEPKALAGFDIERFRPSLVCIEAHLDVRQEILEYFARHGYVVIGKYLRADAHNLYFKPLGG
jgi:FkbM family methyltransferase